MNQRYFPCLTENSPEPASSAAGFGELGRKDLAKLTPAQWLRGCPRSSPWARGRGRGGLGRRRAGRPLRPGSARGSGGRRRGRGAWRLRASGAAGSRRHFPRTGGRPRAGARAPHWSHQGCARRTQEQHLHKKFLQRGACQLPFPRSRMQPWPGGAEDSHSAGHAELIL